MNPLPAPSAPASGTSAATTSAVSASAGDLVSVPVAQPALVVLLRNDETGALLAREPVRPEDLASHTQEAWRDACLRQGCPGVSLAAIAMSIRPVFKDRAHSNSRCAGFGLDTLLPDGRRKTTAFTVHSLAAVASRASERLVTLGKLRDGQTYTYEVHFQPTPAPLESSAASPESVPVLDFEVSDRSPSLTWLETPLRPLLKQGTAQQLIEEHAFHVFFTQQAFARAEQFARKGAATSPPVETGAVLVGAPCSCPDTGEFFVVVSDVYEVIGAEQNVFSLAYTDRSWNRIQTVLRARQQRCPALRLVGQAHGHNFLPAGGKTCEACPTRAVCDLTNIYASADDENWTRAVFSGAPYALCAIFGLSARADRIHGVFTQRDTRLRQRGYFIIPEFHPERWPWRTAAVQQSSPPRAATLTQPQTTHPALEQPHQPRP